jgi:ornithine lipid ester-linked acyl 2-hydroxylase
MMFYDAKNFEFTTHLERNWRVIQQELQQLGDRHFIPWKETALYETGWDVFGLYAFGQRIDENCQRCPQTTQIVEAIPGLITAAFSSLKPQTHIKPHIGYHYDYIDGQLTRMELNDTVLRCHLGLIVPPTYTPFGCAIRIGEELENWQEGQCLVFDDTVEHEAWNRSQGTRIVLLIDFKKSPASSLPDLISYASQSYS